MSLPAHPFASSPHYVDIPRFGRVPLFNLMPHALTKYAELPPSNPTQDGERPKWRIPPSGWQLVAMADTAVSAETESYVFGSEEVAPWEAAEPVASAPRFTRLTCNHQCGTVLQFADCAGELTGKAVVCSSLAAELIKDFKTHGIHVFVPNTDPRASVRTPGGQIIGCRALFNYTRY